MSPTGRTTKKITLQWPMSYEHPEPFVCQADRPLVLNPLFANDAIVTVLLP